MGHHLVALVLAIPVLAGGAAAQEQFNAFYSSGSSFGSYPDFAEQPEQPLCCAPYWWGKASADRGRLFVENHTFQSAGFIGGAPQASAEYKVFDVVFGAPAGVNATTVYVFATIDGDYSGSVSGPTSYWTANHVVGVSLGFPGTFGGEAARSNWPAGWPAANTGLLTGYSMQDPHDIVAGPFVVPTNTPVVFSIFVQATVQSVTGGGASTFAKVTLGQGSGDLGGAYDVFGLDPGITANSVSAGIVDNQFTPATEVGFRFCQPLAPNSSGVDATLTAMGSAEAAANDLTLVVAGLPLAGTTAMLINSMNAWAGVNNPASGGVASDGRICIGGGTFGRHGQHIYSGTAGTFSAPLDLTALPHASLAGTYSVPVLAGQTWYWQCWYRDQSLGAGRSNFSAALGIHFE